MDYVIFNSVYKDFRDAILDNIPDVTALIKRVSSAIPPICNVLSIGYIKIKLIAPSSIIAKDGLNEEKIVYEDPAGYEAVPLIQTYRTGENGMATIEVRAKKNHKFSNAELQAAKLVCDDLFIMFGRARLMGAIHYASQTDTMTGCPNTAKLVHHSIVLKAQNKLQNYSGIFLNLKNYKYINQSKTPVIGDKGITLFAHYVMSMCHDGEMIARLGGDNFFVLVKKENRDEFVKKLSSVNLSVPLPQSQPIPLTIQSRMGVYDYHHDSGRSDRPGVRSDAPLSEHAQETLTVSPYKAYVEVVADFSSDGRMKPLRLVWEDGRKYDIDQILRVDRCASLKAGGAGIRYVCRILGQRVELFYEENGFWFVNRKTPRA